MSNVITGGDGYLQPYNYLTYGNKVKLEKIEFHNAKNKGVINIALSNIWIHGLPADHLKGLGSRWPNEKGVYTRNAKGEFEITFNTDIWEKNCFEIYLSHDGGKPEPLPVLPNLRISGIKKWIQKKYPQDRPYQVFIYKNNVLLSDNNTLDECEIDGKNNKIESTQSKKSDKPSLGLQKSTGSEYVSIPEFRAYFREIDKKIGIVCHLVNRDTGKSAGTGFLIGKRVILTCQHVLEDKDISQIDAEFFYEEKSPTKTLRIPLDREICSSNNPGKKTITKDRLDFAIVLLKTGKSLNFAPRLNVFFKKLSDEQKKKIKLSDRLPRANIIQHPAKEVKQIAFRENIIHEEDDFLLHYSSKTQTGSSGSPVLDDQGNLIGVHRSECLLIQQALVKHRHEFFKRVLEYQLPDEKNKTFHIIQDIQVHFSKRNKGYCYKKVIENGKEILVEYSILDFINPAMLKENETKGMWAIDFLKEQGVIIDPIHIHCNTAINIDMIFKRLEKISHVANVNESELDKIRKADVSHTNCHIWIAIVAIVSIASIVGYCNRHSLIKLKDHLWSVIQKKIPNFYGSLLVYAMTHSDRRFFSLMSRGPLSETVISR